MVTTVGSNPAMEKLEGLIHYTEHFDDPAFFDVFLYSETGVKYGINKSVLASGSRVCQAVLTLSDHPVDEPAYISTNFNSEDLKSFMSFCKFGGPLADSMLRISLTENAVCEDVIKTELDTIPKPNHVEETKHDVSINKLAKVVFDNGEDDFFPDEDDEDDEDAEMAEEEEEEEEGEEEQQHRVKRGKGIRRTASGIRKTKSQMSENVNRKSFTLRCSWRRSPPATPQRGSGTRIPGMLAHF